MYGHPSPLNKASDVSNQLISLASREIKIEGDRLFRCEYGVSNQLISLASREKD